MLGLKSTRCVLPRHIVVSFPWDAGTDSGARFRGGDDDEEAVVCPATVIINGPKIIAVLLSATNEDIMERYPDITIEDHGDAVIMPGLVDAKASLCDPGFRFPKDQDFFAYARDDRSASATDDEATVDSSGQDAINKCWEGFKHGTRAAAAGGVTYLADFPCHGHRLPASTVTGFKNKIEQSKGQILVDCSFYALATDFNVFSAEYDLSLCEILRAGAIGVVLRG